MAASDRQVGGTHYKSGYQHWDFVAECELGYFEGQISKYVMRHRKKNGLQDIQKARHFLERLREEVAINPTRQRHGKAISFVVERFRRLCQENKLELSEVYVVSHISTWTHPRDLEEIAKELARIEATYGQPV